MRFIVGVKSYMEVSKETSDMSKQMYIHICIYIKDG